MALSFPQTRLSVLEALQGEDVPARGRAREALVEAYWEPVRTYLRLRWRLSDDDAQDATQEFFTALVEKDWLARYDPSRSRLRTYLRVCLDGQIANARKASGREKRGGGAGHVTLDDVPETGTAETPEALFDRAFVRHLLGRAVAELERRSRLPGRMGRSNHEIRYEIFHARDVAEPGPTGAEAPSYSELAARFRIKPTDVTNHLAAARRELRSILCGLLGETAISEEEAREEARALLALLAGKGR
ncbi:MAG: sigma-70 family RNA polymerase sigma factor [Acidobacteria bacterium]|nr:sigma-70 family RNA polymerase sigma factor [Acidobacteriota bacterium]